MNEKIGFIGIGQAGGNIVNLFHDKGYKTFAINTSKEDLEVVNIDNKYLIPESFGCNHDRSKAVHYAKKHHVEILQLVEKYLGGCDIIYTVYSTGGGTGSGIGVVLTELLTLNYSRKKTIGNICILPSLDEPIKVQLNAYNSFVQLSKIKSMGSVIVIDNEKKDKVELEVSNTSKDKRISLNIKFVELFEEFIKLPQYKSVRGNIDYAEILEIINTRGCMVIGKSDTPSGLTDEVQNSIFAELAGDKKIMYTALSLNEEVDQRLLDNTLGVPYDKFINYNDEKSVIVLAGLSFPEGRINSIKERLEGTRGHVTDLIDNTINNSLEHNLEWVNPADIVKPIETVDFESIFKVF